MSTTGTPPIRELTEWVRRTLQAPVRLNESLLDFMEATFGTREPGDILADMEGSEAGPFLELLFYPDGRIRLEYEQQWGEDAFSDGQTEALINELLAAPIAATLQTDHPPFFIGFQLPDFAVASFVEKLRITWRPPERLPATVHGALDDSHRIQVRALLRQSRIDWHEGRIAVLDHFLAHLPAASDDFDSCLRFLLSILPELGPDDDPFQFLVDRKWQYFQALCRQLDFERRRRDSNMEILMLQGAYASHGDIEQWRTGMRLIDRICTALYGRTQYFQRPVERRLDVRNSIAGVFFDGS